jgi:hypothetical protein
LSEQEVRRNKSIARAKNLNQQYDGHSLFDVMGLHFLVIGNGVSLNSADHAEMQFVSQRGGTTPCEKRKE